MNLIDLFRIQAVTRAGKTAIRFEGRDMTFGELDKQSNRLARALQRLGLQRGDRVAFYLNNSLELILAYLANLKLGVVTVPMNTQYRDTEIGHIVHDAEPRLILADRTQWPILEGLRPHLQSVEHILVAEELDHLMAAESPDAVSTRVDGRRPGDDHVHLRHDGPLQRRAAHPR